MALATEQTLRDLLAVYGVDGVPQLEGGPGLATEESLRLLLQAVLDGAGGGEGGPHTHTMGQITGLTEALAELENKAPVVLTAAEYAALELAGTVDPERVYFTVG